MGTLSRLPSALPRVTSAQDDEDTIVIRIPRALLAPAAAVASPDELVAFPFGLEPRAARALVRSGTLPAAKIGRRTYAKRSDVLALVDKLASKRERPSRDATDPNAAYAELVARARGGSR